MIPAFKDGQQRYVAPGERLVLRRIASRGSTSLGVEFKFRTWVDLLDFVDENDLGEEDVHIYIREKK